MEQNRELRIIVEHESNGRKIQIDEIPLSVLLNSEEVEKAEEDNLDEAISECLDDWAKENIHIYASYRELNKP